jgi:hypothetical protein
MNKCNQPRKNVVWGQEDVDTIYLLYDTFKCTSYNLCYVHVRTYSRAWQIQPASGLIWCMLRTERTAKHTV